MEVEKQEESMRGFHLFPLIIIMKVKLVCHDGVEQTHYINPKNLEKFQEKYGEGFKILK